MLGQAPAAKNVLVDWPVASRQHAAMQASQIVAIIREIIAIIRARAVLEQCLRAARDTQILPRSGHMSANSGQNRLESGESVCGEIPRNNKGIRYRIPKHKWEIPRIIL